jgi:hypothetical protein
MIASVSGKRAKQYQKRQHLLEIGQPALDYITEIVHRRPHAWIGEIDRAPRPPATARTRRSSVRLHACP